MINESCTIARRAALISAVLLSTACSNGRDSAGGADSGIKARALVSSQYCEPAEPQVLLVQEREVLRKLTGDAALDSDADFRREVVLLIALGTRPTAGFELQLVDDHASLDHTAATLRMRERKPGPDDVAAQVLTTPCLGVALQPGAYESVQVLLEDGTRLGVTAVARSDRS
jgi:hypothetical protein